MALPPRIAALAGMRLATDGRPRAFALIVGGIPLALPGVVAIGAAGAVADGTADAGRTALVFGALLMLCAAPLWLARRIWSSGLWLGSDGALVRGPLRTQRVDLSEIAAFEPGVQPGLGNGTPCVVLRRVSGRPVGVWALGTECAVWKYEQVLRDKEPICHDLNQLLAHLQRQQQ